MTKPSLLRLTALMACVLATAVPAFAAPAETVSQLLAQTQQSRLLLVGEMHGTEEAPELVVQIAGQWLDGGTPKKPGAPVIVALEYPQTETIALAAYLASDGGPQATKRYLETPFWNRAFQDGRSSQSMFALVEALRKRIQRGSPVRVLPFDMNAVQINANLDRDLAMANNLRTIVKANPAARVVALMGNYHARQQDGAPWNPSHRFMGGHLKDLAPFSVQVEARRGGYWGCFGPKPADCKIVTFAQDDSPAGVRTDERIRAIGYNLRLTLEQFTPSLPKITDSPSRTDGAAH